MVPLFFYQFSSIQCPIKSKTQLKFAFLGNLQIPLPSYYTMRLSHLYFLAFLLIAFACKKDPKDNIEGIKKIPTYTETPTLKVENYVNRVFIDLISREPTDSEMTYFVNFLKENDLQVAARDTMAYRLQFDTTFSEGEGSYNEAYFQWFYEKSKGRFYKELSADEIFLEEIGIVENSAKSDSLNGDTVAFAQKNGELNKLRNVLRSKNWYRNGEIEFGDMMRFMIFNSVFDFINMNTINMIDASFDNLFYRYPIQSERNDAFVMIENNASIVFLGQSGSTKEDYVRIVTESREFYNGMVLWAYKSLMARNPSSLEASYALQELYLTKDFQKLERQLITTDEYAQFTPTYK